MARRRFHRVLGETSLELKCLALFGVFLLLVCSASFLSYWRVTETVVKEEGPRTGRVMAERAMLITHWEGLESAAARDTGDLVKDLREKISRQVMFEEDPRSRRGDNKKGEERKAKEGEGAAGPPDKEEPIGEDRENIEWLILSPAPRPSGRGVLPEDDFERQLMEAFRKVRPKEPHGPDSVEYRDRFRIRDGSRVYEYYMPFRYRARDCSNPVCHKADQSGRALADPAPDLFGSPAPGGLPWTEGEVMGVVRVSIPTGPLQRQVSFYWNALLAVAIITGFLALIAFYVTIRYLIVRPLKHLRDVSDAVTHGNVALRADIRTGDEFELLGAAFNRMLRHLVTAQDELRHVNTDLDAKVDELAQLNVQLYEMNRIKSDFLATMSHELRTPLNSILGFSDVLGSIDSLDERQKRYVQNIQKSGRMLLEMINNVLDLAKMESGKMEIRLSEFQIERVVAAQCDMARPLTEKKNIDLETDVQADLPPMMQDQARVQQILNNLLSNAIKFTPEGGRILVAAHRNERGDLLLRVVDTGVGIAKEDQQAIFEKFRQGRTALPDGDPMTREYPGTGLGLSIVKEMCRLLEGEVSVESELGTGSAFTVRLPWVLEKKPRLDSAMALGLEQFAKTRLDLPHDRTPDQPEMLSATGRSRGEGGK
jgi:signal transduction histidine kinase